MSSGDNKCVPYTSKRISNPLTSKDSNESLKKMDISNLTDNKLNTTPSPKKETPSTPPAEEEPMKTNKNRNSFQGAGVPNLSSAAANSKFFSPVKSSNVLSPTKSRNFMSPYSGSNSQLPGSPGSYYISNKRTSSGSYRVNLFPPETPDRLERGDRGISSPGLLSPSPAVNTEEILRSPEKLQEISSKMKNRLSHALSKIQNNEELDTRPSKRRSQNLSGSPGKDAKHRSLPSSFNNNLLTNLSETSKLTAIQNTSGSGSGSVLMEPFNTTPKRNSTKPRSIYMSRNNSRGSIPSYNFESEDHMLSANEAFLAAIQRTSPNTSNRLSKVIKKGKSNGKKDVYFETDDESKGRRLRRNLDVDDDDDDDDELDDDDDDLDDAGDKVKEQEAVQSLLNLSSPIAAKRSSWNSPLLNSSPTLSASQKRSKAVLHRLNSSISKDSSSTEEEIDVDELPRSGTPMSQIKSAS